mgnify:CR=1 FL=1|jgi:hypothetical protein
MESNVQKILPLLKLLPEKVGNVELALDDVKQRLVNDYVTDI